jgi:glycosyltransferase involved in cell wall biosynthesis
MKIIFLAPGLARVKRGLERFFLELSGELRKAGFDASCWGTSEAPGVEAIPVPSRIELEKFAREHLQSVAALPPVPTPVLQTWALYAEDQFFAMPAAMRIRQLLDRGELLLVYARWQGGLLDPSGDSTELLKVVAKGIEHGRAALLVHTDYFYAPIVSSLRAHGACFHSLGPWLTEPLCQQGVAPEAIVELPMCIDAAPYRNTRESHELSRRELGIPPDAFAILSVGVFDMPAKRHQYVLEEILKVGGEKIWWIVAGARGEAPAAWEAQARRSLGPRFIAATDVAFEKMPRLYAAADLFASASLYETFGLVYLEAQTAGLPVVIHDTPITRHLFAPLADRFKPISLVDMRKPGAAAAAFSRWVALLRNPRDRENTAVELSAFAHAQERQFGWNSMGVQFAAMFDKVMRVTAARNRGAQPSIGPGDEHFHQLGVQLFEQGRHADALTAIGRALAMRETPERWNDWATVQSALSKVVEAEQGFRRALAAAPAHAPIHAQVAANLGAILAASNRFAEAIPLLESSLTGVDEKQRLAIQQLLQSCRAPGHCAPTTGYDSASANSPMPNEPAQSAPLRILVIFETLPLPDGGGADHRLMQIIRLLREQGHAVTFLAPRTTGEGKRATALEALGVEIRLHDAEVLRGEGVDIPPPWTLEGLLRGGQFDLAFVSLWFWMGVTLPEHYLDEIRRFSPSTRIAVLTDDCHGLREMGGAEISGLWSDRERAADFAERETEIYRRSDLVISISQQDKDKLSEQADPTPIDVLPMMIEPGPPGPAFDEREGLVYLGHFNNPPTLDGLDWYIREVTPLVYRDLPDLKLYVIGAGLPETWGTSDPNVVRLGFKLDLSSEFARRRLLISPVRYGTGIKTKNLHALAHGLPIVTNAKGADGGNFISGETAFIADDPREFAAAVVRLYKDSQLWQKLSTAGRAHARKYFSKEAMDAALRSILDRARDLHPQPYDPAHQWSMRRVEKMFLEVLSFQPPKLRHSVRVLAYSRAAEQFLAQGNPAEARRQLRHVFNYFSHSVSRSLFFGSFGAVAQSMERTYRALGESHGADEFRAEGRQFSSATFPDVPAVLERSAELSAGPVAALALDKSEPATSEPARRNRAKSEKLDFSVVLPTYNRADVLAACLQALDAQSISSHRFEVIVVDDGSTDATAGLCSNHNPRHEFHYLTQQNGGAGAARRLGVEHARGKYLLLINDDTIASSDLLARHLAAHRSQSRSNLAVLGSFNYPESAKKRALTWFLRCQPFLFPQADMKPGIYTNHSFFITCNISVCRDAVLAAGNFDPAFRVGEDTELGIRLIQKGLKILYVPEASAVHQHLDFTIADLLRRSEVYGNTLVKLFAKHPDLVSDGLGVLGTLDAKSLNKINLFIAENEAEVPQALESLSKFDHVDFTPFFSRQLDGKNAADVVIDLFTHSIPTVYWFHLFRSFLAARSNPPSPTFPSRNPDLVAQSADA